MKRLAMAILTGLLLSSTVSTFASSSPAGDLRAALTTYRQALVKKDMKTLEQIWTDDYMFINGHGRVRTKADRLADLRSGSTSLDSITHENEPRIQIHGNVGIITSDVTLVGRYNGKEVSGEFRSTHIWINDNNRWRLLMNQLTPIEK